LNRWSLDPLHHWIVAGSEDQWFKPMRDSRIRDTGSVIS